MLPDLQLAIEHSRPRNFFEQLWAPDQQVARVPARIESFHEQFEKLRVHDQQFEKHAPQPVRFHEPNELIQRHVGIGGPLQPAKK